MQREFEDVLKKYVCHNELVGVAVSGGRDSMCLLRLAQLAQEKLGFRLFVVHFNHNLRGEESERDEQFVASYCAQNNIAFYSKAAQDDNSTPFEGFKGELAARNARFEYFIKLKSELGARWLLLAHHAQDQAETILLQMLRGCGLRGARGMDEIRDNYFLRPLLNVEPKQIEAFIQEQGIPFVVDSTNRESDYNRNYLRNQVFPLLNMRWNASQSLCVFAQIAARDDEFINSITPSPQKCKDTALLEIRILNQPHAIGARYIRKGLELLGALSDITETNVQDILNLSTNISGKQISLPNGLIARREYEHIIIERAQELCAQPVQRAFEGAGVYDLGGVRVQVQEYSGIPSYEHMKECAPNVLFADAHKLNGATLRFRKNQDSFTPIGGGTRTLKKYFIDNKIPLPKRAKIPLLTKGGEVLVVFGVNVAQSVCLTPQAKKVFSLKLLN